MPDLPQANQSDISGTVLKILMLLGTVFLFGKYLLKKSSEEKPRVTTTIKTESRPTAKPKPVTDAWGLTPIDKRPVGLALIKRDK